MGDPFKRTHPAQAFDKWRGCDISSPMDLLSIMPEELTEVGVSPFPFLGDQGVL